MNKLWEWLIRNDAENGYVVVIVLIVAAFVGFWMVKA